MNTAEIVQDMSVEDLEKILEQKKEAASQSKQQKRKEYEGTRDDVVLKLIGKAKQQNIQMKSMKEEAATECAFIYDLMKEYGDLKNDNQGSFTVKTSDGRFKITRKNQKQKGFDERAIVAEEKLRLYLTDFIKDRNDPGSKKMYKLAMSLLERNASGDLDVSLVSRLYKMEDEFEDSRYTDIMDLFRESYTENSTATYFQFFEKQPDGRYLNIELSFSRL
jgi:hypothetical protein